MLLLLLLSVQDLHGSDLENMSLSKRFLKEGERAGVSTAQGSQGIQAVTETRRLPGAWLQANGKKEAPSAQFIRAHWSWLGPRGSSAQLLGCVVLPTSHPRHQHTLLWTLMPWIPQPLALGPKPNLPNVVEIVLEILLLPLLCL